MIIDASVGSKWILQDEDNREKSLLLLRTYQTGEEKIIVPDLFFYEIANVLVTKADLPKHQIDRSLKIIFKTNLIVYHPIYEDILKATKLAKEYKTTVYDMLYAVVAKNKKTVLITADEKFVTATRFPHVKHLSKLQL